MQEAIADLVYPVFDYGLALKDQLDRGESPNFETHQSALFALVQKTVDPRLLTDRLPTDSGLAPNVTANRPDPLRAFRYALASWLDEIFIIHLEGTSWSERWKDQSLERKIFKSRDRAERFWEHAERVQSTTKDEKEVYFLCVMLGFRGKYRSDIEGLRKWVGATQAAIASALDEMERNSRLPESLPFPPNVPPLRGREAFHRMGLFLGAAVLLCILLGTLAVTVWYHHK